MIDVIFNSLGVVGIWIASAIIVIVALNTGERK